MRDLKRSMLDYDAETLAAIAATRGIAATGDVDDLRAELVRQGSSRLSLSLLWEQLAEPERAALCRLAAAGGAIRTVYFESEYGALRQFGPGKLARERLWEQPAPLTARLYFLGLIFRGFEDGGQAAIWYVPGDVQAGLPVPACATAIPAAPAPLPGAAAESRPAGDLLALAVLHSLIAARGGARRPAEGAARRLALDAPDLDEERLSWLGLLGERLAHEMGFLHGSRITPSGRARVRRWLGLGRRQAVLGVAEAWAGSGGWHELRQAPGLRFEGGRLPDARPARQALLTTLAQFEPGRWYSVPDLKAWLRQSQPGFLRTNADFESLYVRDAASGETLDGIGAWMGVEGRFVDEVLFILNGLGAVDLGSTADTRLFAVTAAAWWRPEVSPSEAVAAGISLDDDDLALVVSGEAALSHLYQAETFAAPQGSGHYLITRASLQRAEAQGVGIETVCAYLGRHAGVGDAALARVRRLVQPPTVLAEPLVALSTDDASALETLLAGDAAIAAGVHRLDDGRVAVSRDAWQQLAERLRQLGWQVERRR
ncbi:MAG: hypothetical protein ACYC5O_03535 [Anaerolineae bacterium]